MEENIFHLRRRKLIFLPHFYDDVLNLNLGAKFDSNNLNWNLSIQWEGLKKAQM